MTNSQPAPKSSGYERCPHRYHDIIGGDKAFGMHKSNADCIPCLYASQMLECGQTPDQVESVPQLMKMFGDLLEKTGWTWQQVRDSFERLSKGSRQNRGL